LLNYVVALLLIGNWILSGNEPGGIPEQKRCANALEPIKKHYSA
jgi:hypothetical protein